MNADKLAYSPAEAFELMSIGHSLGYQLMERGELEYVQVSPGKRLIPRWAIDQVLARTHHNTVILAEASFG